MAWRVSAPRLEQAPVGCRPDHAQPPPRCRRPVGIGRAPGAAQAPGTCPARHQRGSHRGHLTKPRHGFWSARPVAQGWKRLADLIIRCRLQCEAASLALVDQPVEPAARQGSISKGSRCRNSPPLISAGARPVTCFALWVLVHTATPGGIFTTSRPSAKEARRMAPLADLEDSKSRLSFRLSVKRQALFQDSAVQMLCRRNGGGQRGALLCLNQSAPHSARNVACGPSQAGGRKPSAAPC